MPKLNNKVVGVWEAKDLAIRPEHLPPGRSFATLWTPSLAPLVDITAMGMPVVYAGRWYVDVVRPWPVPMPIEISRLTYNPSHLLPPFLPLSLAPFPLCACVSVWKQPSCVIE